MKTIVLLNEHIALVMPFSSNSRQPTHTCCSVGNIETQLSATWFACIRWRRQRKQQCRLLRQSKEASTRFVCLNESVTRWNLLRLVDRQVMHSVNAVLQCPPTTHLPIHQKIRQFHNRFGFSSRNIPWMPHFISEWRKYLHLTECVCWCAVPY